MPRSAFGMVASQQIPVVPKPDDKGYKQPPYIRSTHAVQTSSRLIEFQQCVANAMAGKHFPDRGAVREALAAAAKACKGRRGREEEVF